MAVLMLTRLLALVMLVKHIRTQYRLLLWKKVSAGLLSSVRAMSVGSRTVASGDLQESDLKGRWQMASSLVASGFGMQIRYSTIYGFTVRFSRG